MSIFKDNFSKQSDLYVKYRPTYPMELFEYLSTLMPEHALAWDCGTGNGQSAIGLTPYFKSIYATDPSEAQIRNAMPHPQITYKVETAEQNALEDQSVDLITIAQAIHWFDFDVFYPTVKRVLKKEGVIAAWCYGLPVISKEIDPVIRHFHNEVLGAYWLPENRMIEKEYTTLPFPFTQIEPHPFSMHKEWNFDAMVGWLSTWSALQRYIHETGSNPLENLEQALAKVWKTKTATKTVTWKLVLKLGRNTL